MSFLNILLFLILTLYLIDYLTHKQLSKIIIKLINRFYALYKTKIEKFTDLLQDGKIRSTTGNIPFITQPDFPYMNNYTMHNFDEKTYYLYNFLDSLITPHANIYELTYSSNNERILATGDIKNDIIRYLDNIFNTGQFQFYDIKLLNDIYYYTHHMGKNIEMFKFTASVKYKSKYFGSLIFAIELFIKEKRYFNVNKLLYNFSNESLFHCNKQSLLILSIKLLGNLSPNKNLSNEIFDNFFIKSEEKYSASINDTENSLIPSIVTISASYNDNDNDD